MPSFPVDLEQYFEAVGGLKVPERHLDISDPRAYAETYNGEGIISHYGTPLWYGSVTIVPLHNALARQCEARVRSLLRADALFNIGDLMVDPMVEGHGNAQIETVATTNATLITLANMQPNYLIPTGTYISFTYGGGRLAFHQVVNGGRTSTDGRCRVEVWPLIQPGWEAGTLVKFNTEARCRAYMVPGSLKMGVGGPDVTQGFTFNWRQTNRA